MDIGANKTFHYFRRITHLFLSQLPEHPFQRRSKQGKSCQAGINQQKKLTFNYKTYT